MQPRGTYNQLIDEMLLALTANINYLKKNGSSQIRIRNGRLVSVLESGHIYDFQLEQLQEIDVDSAEAIEKHGLLIIKLPKLDKNRSTRLKVRGN